MDYVPSQHKSGLVFALKAKKQIDLTFFSFFGTWKRFQGSISRHQIKMAVYRLHFTEPSIKTSLYDCCFHKLNEKNLVIKGKSAIEDSSLPSLCLKQREAMFEEFKLAK